MKSVNRLIVIHNVYVSLGRLRNGLFLASKTRDRVWLTNGLTFCRPEPSHRLLYRCISLELTVNNLK